MLAILPVFNKRPSGKGREVFRSPAFTLVELLVVVAIMGALAALLLPVASKADASAKTAKCLSNLRQLGVACRLYSNENENRLIPICTGTSASDGATWRAAILPYLDLPAGDKQMNVFRCPADPNARKQVGDPPYYRLPTSYGVNMTMGVHQYLPAAPSNPPSQSKPATALVSPASTIMMADIGNAENPSDLPEFWKQKVSAASGNYGYANFEAPLGANWGVFPRHSRKLNVLYYDGHAGTVDMSDEIVAHPPGSPLCIYDNK